ncbi:MAG: hypothetical protein FWF25_05650, partial [Propionibacteriaceae bacterium]|nr:hypothetical protein [Propionibacteriaceae bacterium]
YFQANWNNFSSVLLSLVNVSCQVANVVYVDDDANQAEVTPAPGTDTSFTGNAGSEIGFTEEMARAGVPANYLFASLDNQTTFDDDDAVDQQIVVHLVHDNETSQLSVSRTITYSGAGAQTPSTVVQPMDWVVTTDMVTGGIYYTSTSSGFPAVASPVIDGYVADPTEVPFLAVREQTSEKPVSTEVTVNYSPTQQVVNVVYVDRDAGGVPVPPTPDTVTKLTGPSGSPVGFTEAMARAGVPSGYSYDSLDNVETYDFADAVDQTITVYLVQEHVVGDFTVTRTIHYQGAGSSTPADVVQSVLWSSTTNLVTGDIVYETASTGYASVDTPAIDGYQADVTQVPAVAVTSPSSTRPQPTAVTVTYKPTTQVANIVYVDNDLSGAVVQPAPGTTTRLTGPSGSAIGFTEDTARAGIPAGYVFVGMDNVASYDFVDAVDQTITVHLAHDMGTANLTVARTIHYVGAGASTPADTVQPITWTATTDHATNTVVYTTTSTQYPGVTTPGIDGYQPDVAQVPALPVTSPTQTKPESSTVTVTYSPTTQTVKVVYVDDDSNGAEVTPVAGTVTTLTGPSGSSVGFTEAQAQAGVPSGYVYKSVDNVTTFDFQDAVDQTITVHLIQDHADGQVRVSRTVHYEGAGSSTPADVVQPMVWSSTTNLVTGNVVYSTSSTGYAAVDSPRVDGYQADVAQVPAVSVTSPTSVKPESSTVTVTYSPTTQTVKVTYVDDDSNGADVTPAAGAVTTLTGPSGSSVGYTEAQAQAGVPSGYVYKSVDNVTTFDFEDAVDQTITVHLVQDYADGQVRVSRTVHYEGAGSSTPADVVQPMVWTSTTNLVTGNVVYSTSSTGYAGVDSPRVDGYQADVALVPAVPVTSPTSVKPVSTDVYVTYSPTMQTVKVVYVDDDSNGALVTPVAGAVTQLTGLSGSAVSYQVSDAKAGVPAAYVYSSLDNVDAYDFVDAVDQTITVHLVHGYDTNSLAVARTIHYVGAGSVTPADVVQPMTWTETTNLVTGVMVYTTTDQGYPAVATPALDGYQADAAQVPAKTPVTPSSDEPKSETVTITYTPTTQTVNVVYVDDDLNQAPVTPVAGTIIRLTGPSGSAVGYTEQDAKAGVPAAYEYKSVNNVDTFDFVDAADQTITVHLVHGYSTGELPVTRTVEYVGAGTFTPKSVVQPMAWTATTDKVTGDIVYTSTDPMYPSVETPDVAGFKADLMLVPQVKMDSPTPDKPVSMTVTVTYAPTTQIVNVVFVDDDAGGATVTPVTGTPTKLTGPSGSKVGYVEDAAKKGVPSEYVYVSLDNVDAYDYADDTDQTITVHLKQGYQVTTMETTRTIEYVGAGNSTPQAVVQPITWTVTKNLVTTAETYTTDSAGYPAVTTPVVDGFTTTIDEVPALSVAKSTEVEPQSLTVVVPYEAIIIHTGGSVVPRAAAASTSVLEAVRTSVTVLVKGTELIFK